MHLQITIQLLVNFHSKFPRVSVFTYNQADRIAVIGSQLTFDLEGSDANGTLVSKHDEV